MSREFESDSSYSSSLTNDSPIWDLPSILDVIVLFHFLYKIPHRFVPYVEFQIYINKRISFVISSFFSKGTRSHPPIPSRPCVNRTKKIAAKGVVEKASLYSPLDPRGRSSWLSATRLIENSILYIHYTWLSVSCRPFQPLYLYGREGRPLRKTLIGSVHAVDSQALIIIFFDSRLSPARAARA